MGDRSTQSPRTLAQNSSRHHRLHSPSSSKFPRGNPYIVHAATRAARSSPRYNVKQTLGERESLINFLRFGLRDLGAQRMTEKDAALRNASTTIS